MTSQLKPQQSLLKLIGQKKYLVVLLLGFSSGLPIMIIYGTIKLWLRRFNIELSTIGALSLISLPYSLNFFWAFLFDHYTPLKKLGRRRSWLFICQIGILVSLILLSLGDPNTNISYIALVGFILCFFSASQDVVVDAYRNEILTGQELGVGASIGIYGYRLGMWTASGLGIWVVDQNTLNFTFNQMLLMMAGFSLVGLLCTSFATEPEKQKSEIRTLYQSIAVPFSEYFKRQKAWMFLAFIFFYKFGDSFAGSMTRPFYVDLGFSNSQIGLIASTLGIFSTILGLFLGGVIIYRLGYFFSLWISGILQALSTFAFALLALSPNTPLFAAVVFFEDLTGGMGTAALVAFMGLITNKKFTATQYALFASLASLGRTLFASLTGYVIHFFNDLQLFTFINYEKTNGYVEFYLLGAILALPGLIILYRLKKTMQNLIDDI